MMIVVNNLVKTVFFVRNVYTIKYSFATEFTDLPLVLKHIWKLSTNDSLKV